MITPHPAFCYTGCRGSRENRKLFYWTEPSFFRESGVLILTLLSNSCKPSDFTPLCPGGPNICLTEGIKTVIITGRIQLLGCTNHCSDHFAYMIYLNGKYYYYLPLTDASESRMFKWFARSHTAGKWQMEDSHAARLTQEPAPPRYQMPLLNTRPRCARYGSSASNTPTHLSPLTALWGRDNHEPYLQMGHREVK